MCLWQRSLTGWLSLWKSNGERGVRACHPCSLCRPRRDRAERSWHVGIGKKHRIRSKNLICIGAERWRCWQHVLKGLRKRFQAWWGFSRPILSDGGRGHRSSKSVYVFVKYYVDSSIHQYGRFGYGRLDRKIWKIILDWVERSALRMPRLDQIL